MVIVISGNFLVYAGAFFSLFYSAFTPKSHSFGREVVISGMAAWTVKIYKIFQRANNNNASEPKKQNL